MNGTTVWHHGTPRYHVQSWLFSLIFHGVATVLAILFVSDLRLAPQPEPFTWDVSVVEAPRVETHEAPTPPPPQAPPTPAKRTPSPRSTTPAVRAAESRPIEHQVVRQEIRRQAIQEVQEVHRQEVRTQPILEHVAQPTPEPIAQETLSRTADPIPAPQPVAAQTLETAHRQEVSAESISAPEPVAAQAIETAALQEVQPVVRETTPATTTTETPVTREVVSEPTSIVHAAPASVSQSTVERVETVEPATVQERSVVTETRTVPSEPAVVAQPAPEAVPSPHVSEQTVIAKLPPQGVVEQAPAHQLPVHAAPKTKADYSWLVQALWGKVEQAKRYPAIARMNRWEGKVVLKAVIREDGTLAELEVSESSGHAILDRDAMEIIRRVSPLKLTHPLGIPQVTVQVPINYQLRR